MSYTNQPQHRHLDRRVIKDFLTELARSTTSEHASGETADQKLQRLLRATDTASPSESDFLRFLHQNGYRLPDRAQNRPAEDVFVQPDFYYERDGIPGACVFIDGSVHTDPDVRAHDEEVRQQLRDRGFRVISIDTSEGWATSVGANPDVFGVATP